MPINYKEYHPDWKAISLRIRKERAGDKCEWCAAPNGMVIKRSLKDRDLPWRLADGGHEEAQLASDGEIRLTKIVLTVAHIDRDKTNNDDANLAALCQRCHLNHDRKQHAENRRNGRNWKRDQTKMEL